MSTTAGALYELSFDAGAAYGNFTGNLKVVADSPDGEIVLAELSSHDLGNNMSSYSYKFGALAGATNIRFVFDGSGGGDIDLDNISLTQASSMDLTNSGLEAEHLNNGAWKHGIAGWDKVGHTHAGVWNPTQGHFKDEAAEGENIGWINRGAVTQDTGLTYNSALNYDLDLMVGGRLGKDGSAYEITLMAGDTVVAQLSGKAQGHGTWDSVILSAEAGAAPDADGEPLKVVITKVSGYQLNFDEVSITVEEPVVPGHSVFRATNHHSDNILNSHGIDYGLWLNDIEPDNARTVFDFEDARSEVFVIIDGDTVKVQGFAVALTQQPDGSYAETGLFKLDFQHNNVERFAGDNDLAVLPSFDGAPVGTVSRLDDNGNVVETFDYTNKSGGFGGVEHSFRLGDGFSDEGGPWNKPGLSVDAWFKGEDGQHRGDFHFTLGEPVASITGRYFEDLNGNDVEDASFALSALEGAAVISIEAEDMDLDGYSVSHSGGASEGDVVLTWHGPGKAETTFNGDAGVYRFDLDVMDETDGNSTINVFVNGKQIESFVLDDPNADAVAWGSATSLRTVTIDAVKLEAGDVLTFEGIRDRGEPARFDKVDLVQLDAAHYVIEAEDMELTGGYRTFNAGNASGGQGIQNTHNNTPELATATTTFDGEAGTYTFDLRVYDENDGEASITIYVNDQEVAAFKLDQGVDDDWIRDGALANVIVEDIELKPGDKIAINGVRDAGEMARIDKIDLWQTKAADPGIAGKTVVLLQDGQEVARTTTDQDGDYQFIDVEPGDGYQVLFEDVEGSNFVSPNVGNDEAIDSDAASAAGDFGATGTFSVGAGETVSNVDAGQVAPIVEEPCTVRLENHHSDKIAPADYGIWIRGINGDDVTVLDFEADGAAVYLTIDGDQITIKGVAIGRTKQPDGSYVDAGPFALDFTYGDVEQVFGDNDLIIKSDADGVWGGTISSLDNNGGVIETFDYTNKSADFSGVVHSLRLGDGFQDAGGHWMKPGTSVDAWLMGEGFNHAGDFHFTFGDKVEIGAISGRYFNDNDGNDLESGGDTGVAGKIVILLKDGAEVDRTTTDTDGAYTFPTVEVGDGYQVAFEEPDAGTNFVNPNVGGDDARDSDVIEPGGPFGTTAQFSVSSAGVSDVDVGVVDRIVGEDCTVQLLNHPEGGAAEPFYGLRADNLFGDGVYTFDFEADGAAMYATIDPEGGTIRIHGTAVGGVDTGTERVQEERFEIDFTYYGLEQTFGDDDLIMDAARAGKSFGTISRLDESGNVVETRQIEDKAGNFPFSFRLGDEDNDQGHRGVDAKSGWGWLDFSGHDGHGDWLFTVGEKVELAAQDDCIVVTESEGAGDLETLDGGATSILDNDTENGAGVVTVDGTRGNVGEWIDLEKGRIKINADGTVDFDANGDFEDLNDGDVEEVCIEYTIGGLPTGNLIINGDFENHPELNRLGGLVNGERDSWDVFDQIEGWSTPVGKLEIQDGTHGGTPDNPDGNSVLELDSNDSAQNNAAVEQTVMVENAGTYTLAFDYSPRQKGSEVGATSAMNVFVNGVNIGTVSSEELGYERQTFTFELDEGPATIGFSGGGIDDSYGALIDNVALTGTYEVDAKVTVKVEGESDLGGISGRYFCDTNGDGLDNGEAEPALVGVTVWLKDGADNILTQTTTDGDGRYAFTGLAAGDYQVFFQDPETIAGGGKGFVAADQGNDDTIDSDVTDLSSFGNGSTDIISLAAGETKEDVDAGLEELPGSISGRYFCDTNDNDIDDGQATDPGIEGVVVTAFDGNGNVVGTAETAADGTYTIAGLPAGVYAVEFTDPSNVLGGKQLVTPNVGTDDTVDSDAIAGPASSAIFGIVVNPGEDTPDNDAGAEEIAPAVAVDDMVAACADEVLTISPGDLTANDSDADGGPTEPLDVVGISDDDEFITGEGSITLASGATVTLAQDGTISYDGTTAFADMLIGDTAMDTFSYTIENEGGQTATAEVDVKVCGALNTVETIDAFLKSENATVTYSLDLLDPLTNPSSLAEGFTLDLLSSTEGDIALGEYAAAYCIDVEQPIGFEILTTGDVFVATEENAAAVGVNNADKIDSVNWILNNDFTQIDNGDGTGETYTDLEIQEAIWFLLNDETFFFDNPTFDFPELNDNENGVRDGVEVATMDNVMEIAMEAMEMGDGFEAGEGDVLGLIIEPTAPASQDQPFIIGVQFDDLAQDCLCIL